MVRKRDFDTEQVIEKSMNLFWEKGFHGTSLSELTQVTGLHKGSLYGAFKSKENLFQLSLNRYATRMRGLFIQKECPLEYLQKFFQKLVDDGGSGKAQNGCLVMNSGQEFGEENSEKAKLARSLFGEIQQNFRNVVHIAEEQGMIRKDLNKEALVDQLVGGVFSIRELSKFQKNRELFINIANGVLKELEISID